MKAAQAAAVGSGMPDLGHVINNTCSYGVTTKDLFNVKPVQDQIQTWLLKQDWTDVVTSSNANLYRGANFQHAFATIAETPTASMYLVQTEVNVSPTPYNLTSWAIPQLLLSVNTLCIQGALTQSNHANDAYAAICVAPLVPMGMAYLLDGKAVFVLCASPPAQ